MLNTSGFVFVYVVFNNQLLDFGVKKISQKEKTNQFIHFNQFLIKSTNYLNFE